MTTASLFQEDRSISKQRKTAGRAGLFVKGLSSSSPPASSFQLTHIPLGYFHSSSRVLKKVKAKDVEPVQKEDAEKDTAASPPASEASPSSSSPSASASVDPSSSSLPSDGLSQEDVPIKQYSYPELTADAARHKAGLNDPDLPTWQNPLHHNNPDMLKVFPEDFNTPEEFEKAILPAPPLEGTSPAHLQSLAEEIVHLNMLEMSELVNKIAEHYGFHEGMLSPDTVGGGGGDVEDEENDAAAAEPVAEKTVFDVKLVAFDEKAKIKVIKEVRSIAGLGLKEAKETVEGAPKVVMRQVKKEDAEAIKAKLEELGATVELV